MPFTSGNNFSVDGEVIEEVESFEFLGSIINIKSDCTQEIKRRLAIARNVVQSMAKLWKSKLPPSLKVRLLWLKSTAFAVASYGSESWTMKYMDKRCLDAFELRCYRRILRIPWTEKKTNRWALNELSPCEQILLQENCPTSAMSLDIEKI